MEIIEESEVRKMIRRACKEFGSLRARVAELEAERDRYRRALEPDERGTCPVCKWSVSPGHPESHMQGCRAAIALNP